MSFDNRNIRAYNVLGWSIGFASVLLLVKAVLDGAEISLLKWLGFIVLAAAACSVVVFRKRVRPSTALSLTSALFAAGVYLIGMGSISLLVLVLVTSAVVVTINLLLKDKADLEA